MYPTCPKNSLQINIINKQRSTVFEHSPHKISIILPPSILLGGFVIPLVPPIFLRQNPRTYPL